MMLSGYAPKDTHTPNHSGPDAGAVAFSTAKSNRLRFDESEKALAVVVDSHRSVRGALSRRLRVASCCVEFQRHEIAANREAGENRRDAASPCLLLRPRHIGSMRNPPRGTTSFRRRNTEDRRVRKQQPGS
mmetsp:Transcript_2780/g.7638  ORF Transcript_2780/g.7638 Transcript_2780/m.7638 type:complete len:131 (+) Transcript_2780:111-503(+)